MHCLTVLRSLLDAFPRCGVTMSTKRAEFDTLADESDDGSYDGSEYSEESAGSEERKLQQKLEEVKRKKDETENEATTLSRNSQIEARHHKTMVAFAPAWLISPFIPFLESLITIFVGSVLIGTTNVSECTEPLDSACNAGSASDCCALTCRWCPQFTREGPCLSPTCISSCTVGPSLVCAIGSSPT